MSALPPKADIGDHRWNVRFVPTADIECLLSNLLDVRQLPHLVEERLGWGVGAEHDFEATFGIGRRPLSARSGQMHRSKQHPRSQAGVWTSEAERRRPPSDLPERCRRRRVIAMTARAVGARPHTRLALSVA
jgi:hypothetical protein